MRDKSSNGTAARNRHGMYRNALRSLAALALSGWGAAGTAVAAGSAVSEGVASGGGGGGGGAMVPLTLLALLIWLIAGWLRTRSAFLRSAQETESESRDLAP
jgi:hypothetical protein